MVCRCFSRKAAKVTLGISIVVLLIAIAGVIVFQGLYNKILKEKIALSEGSLVTKIWKDIPLPIYEKLYFFNITNKKAFLDGHEPLNVTEVGPYTYKSSWVKKNPYWVNNTVSYRETRTYHFVPELSKGTEDDSIFTINGPMVIGAAVVPSWLRIPFDGYCMLENEEVIIEKTIRELVYEGYDDAIIKYAKDFLPSAPYVDGKFSWLYGKNDSDDGNFTVFTGADDQSKTNLIVSWNGDDKLKFWKGDSCNMINGTSIETGPPIKNHLESYTFFQSIFCRSLSFNFTDDVKHFDIDAKRFRPTYDLFANSTENPDNHCFEVRKEQPSGVLDISPCQFNAPVYISFPHFHLGDPSFLTMTSGLEPDDDKHGSYVDVEPITGLSIDVLVRFQINVEIQKLSGFHFFNELKQGLYPILWVELSLKIDEDLASFLKHSVRDPKIIAYSVIGFLFFSATIGIILSLVVLICGSEEEDQAPLIVKEKNTLPQSKSYTYDQNITTEEKPKMIEKDLSINNSETLKNNLKDLSIEQVESGGR